MAVLNIKSFPDKLYKKLQSRAKRQRRSLAQEIIQILDEAMTESPQLSIMDLEGLGQEIWKRIDTDQYLREERDSWR